MQNYKKKPKKKKTTTTLNIRIYLHYLRILLRMCLSLNKKRKKAKLLKYGRLYILVCCPNFWVLLHSFCIFEKVTKRMWANLIIYMNCDEIETKSWPACPVWKKIRPAPPMRLLFTYAFILYTMYIYILYYI